MFWILALMTAALQPASPQLDFEFFRTRVEPIFLERKEGFTRCVVCHTEGAARIPGGTRTRRGHLDGGAVAGQLRIGCPAWWLRAGRWRAGC